VRPNPRLFSAAAMILGIVIEWFLFYVAYRGILVSGLRFLDVLGKRWSSAQEFWSDFKTALIVVFVICMATLVLMRVAPFQYAQMGHARTEFQYGVTLLMAVTAGFTEEVVFRGLLLGQFRILTGKLSTAVILQAVLFSLAHGGNQSITQFLKHGFSGCIFAYLTIRQKSLWPAILAHTMLDLLAYTIQFLVLAHGISPRG
jgi:membrane protease YdiL (CAAX protease family)